MNQENNNSHVHGIKPAGLIFVFYYVINSMVFWKMMDNSLQHWISFAACTNTAMTATLPFSP